MVNMRGFVETKKTLYLDKEAHTILSDFEILIHDMHANGCEEVEELIGAFENFKSEFEEIIVEED